MASASRPSSIRYAPMSLYGLPKAGSTSMAVRHSAMASSGRPRKLSAQPRNVWASAVGCMRDGPAIVLDRLLEAAAHLRLVAFWKACWASSGVSGGKSMTCPDSTSPSVAGRIAPTACVHGASASRCSLPSCCASGLRRARRQRARVRFTNLTPGAPVADRCHARASGRRRALSRGGPATRLRAARGAVLPLGALARRAGLCRARRRQLRAAGREGGLPVGTG